MPITESFKKAVQDGNVKRVRIMLKDSLLLDPTFQEFNELSNYAKNMNGLYDPHDGRELLSNKAMWTDDYMDKEKVRLIGNFSPERLSHLQQVINHTRPVTPEMQASLAQAAIRHAQSERANVPMTNPNQGLKRLAIGGAVAGGLGLGAYGLYRAMTPIQKDVIGKKATDEITGLTKLARSFDAQRKKQYWQLLKRMYGGNDEAVEELSKTREPGIYHGTKARNVPGINEQGMVVNHERRNGNAKGVGNYLGQKSLAAFYHDGGWFRLKYPSELRGTKTLYPVKNAYYADIDSLGVQNDVLKQQYREAALRQLSDPVFRNKTKEQLITLDLNDEEKELIKNRLTNLRSQLNREVYEEDPFSIKDRWVEVPVPILNQERNALKYYGKLKQTPELQVPLPLDERGRNKVLEAMPRRTNHVIINENIPPSLLRQEVYKR